MIFSVAGIYKNTDNVKLINCAVIEASNHLEARGIFYVFLEAKYNATDIHSVVCLEHKDNTIITQEHISNLLKSKNEHPN